MTSKTSYRRLRGTTVFKQLHELFRTRDGVRYECCEYGATKERAAELVAELRSSGRKAFAERHRTKGDEHQYCVFSAQL